ncbi:MAG TPA: NUDIX domain-containing protein [Ramlibacter sp.]|nr:NUDIX domain-containing protein [Ramlibacter sp.]
MACHLDPSPALDAAWLAGVRAQAAREPLRPRVPLRWQSHVIGSVENEFLAQPALRSALPRQGLVQCSDQGWHIEGAQLSDSLAVLANAMREAGLTGAWRNEQLAVRDASQALVGTVERGAVRPLGIATQAVHLVGLSPDGRHWVQQRAHDKATDPGLWDTLMGGMAPACDTPMQALARETWEEAGLRMDQLMQLRVGGSFTVRRPSQDARNAGYVVERVDWWRCVLADGVTPVNQDGEVQQFALMTSSELRRRLLAGEFTLEAMLALTDGDPPALLQG